MQLHQDLQDVTSGAIWDRPSFPLKKSLAIALQLPFAKNNEEYGFFSTPARCQKRKDPRRAIHRGSGAVQLRAEACADRPALHFLNPARHTRRRRREGRRQHNNACRGMRRSHSGGREDASPRLAKPLRLKERPRIMLDACRARAWQSPIFPTFS